ncbi:MAG TPA: hypothetical protein DCS35_08655 [Vibrio sp.]|nr:hypothetical protein [Vibrio sp.]
MGGMIYVNKITTFAWIKIEQRIYLGRMSALKNRGFLARHPYQSSVFFNFHKLFRATNRIHFE